MTTLFFSEELVSSLQGFGTQQEKVVTPELLKIVDNISKTGVVCYSWAALKPLLSHLLAQSIKSYISKVDAETIASKSADEETDVEKRSRRFIENLNRFDEAPFTVQRLCELILAPEKVYSTYFKYISALEKMVNITSTLPTLTLQQIQTINITGIINPQIEEEPNTTTSTNNSMGQSGEYPMSMNVDLNGIQTSFPHQTHTATPTGESNEEKRSDNANPEEKPPTPMDM